LSKILISTRYLCEQCGEYFNGEVIESFDETFLDHSPLFIHRYFPQEEMHKCYGHVKGGEQRFFGHGKLVGWSWRKSDTKCKQKDTAS